MKLRGTPTFVLGRVKGKTLEGVAIVGALPYDVFETAIERMLQEPVK